MKLFDLNADTPTGDRGALMKGVWGVQRGCSRGEAGWCGTCAHFTFIQQQRVLLLDVACVFKRKRVEVSFVNLEHTVHGRQRGKRGAGVH